MSSDPHSIDTQKRTWDLSPEAFEALLRWLNADREEAGKRYEEIRRKLIRIFACRGCVESDLLADETINRVARKVEELVKTYKGDPALYFYGVANKIHLEQFRKAKQPTIQWQATDADDYEAEFSCLDRCMSKLPTDSRDLVLKYYDHGKDAKIEQRRMLAATLNIGLNALRIRAHRIRRTLHRCIHGCLDHQTSGRLVN
jgi:DNA-directed RNA polymerase specialized sigma24 family protein